MFEFRFLNPLAFLLFVPAIYFLIRWLRDQSTNIPSVLRYSDTRLMQGLPQGIRVRLRRIPDILRFAAWLCLVIALARPQSGSGQEVVISEGVDIIMVIDISRSMSSPDFNPMTRLDAAKVVIEEFINGREFDRIGLVAFAQDAYQQAPPTLDYGVLLELLRDIRLAAELGLPADRTAIGEGIASGANMLRTSESPSRVIILLTDGANNSGLIDPLTAAEAARALGIRIYTIGMGNPAAAIAEDGTQRQFIEGELDEITLVSIARITNGRYYNAADLFDLQAIYEEINELETVRVERQITVRWQDVAWGWLNAALILLILERILRHTIFQTIP